MARCRITVLERIPNVALAERYARAQPVEACADVSEGQRFMMGSASQPPYVSAFLSDAATSTGAG